MITCDSFLTKGKQHNVCEDYIISGYHPFQYIILADGCSSSKNTEMGARLLCYLAKEFVTKYMDDPHNLDYDQMGSWIIYNAELVAKMLGLNESALDATLIVSYVADNHIYIYMYGDGVVISQRNNGVVLIDSISFKNNAPYYLSYKLNKRKMESYLNTKPYMIRTSSTLDNEYLLRFNERMIMPRSMTSFNKVLICSDGIESFFFQNDVSNYDFYDLTEQFMLFKTTKGEFLKRRSKKLIKELAKNNVVNFDDLSIGAYINVEE